VTVYTPRWFTRTQTVIHPSTNPEVDGRELNPESVDALANYLLPAAKNIHAG